MRPIHLTRLCFLWLLISMVGVPSVLGQAEEKEDPLEKLFPTQTTKQSWLKWDVLAMAQEVRNQRLIGDFSLAFEQKIKPAWSIIFLYRQSYRLRWVQGGEGLLGGPARLDAAIRYYPQQSRRRNPNPTVQNFNGGYVGMQLGTQSEWNGSEWYSDHVAMSIWVGKQRQVYQWAYSEFSLGVRVCYGEAREGRFIYRFAVNEGWQVYPVARLSMGLGW